MSWRTPVNASGWLYGAIVTASVFTVVGAHPEDYPRVIAAVVVMLGVYWVSHVYTRVIADQLERPGASVSGQIAAAARHELPILGGGLPAVAVYTLAVLLGGKDHAIDAALWASVVLLGIVGHRVSRSTHSTGWRLVGAVVGCSLVGVVLVVFKALLH